VRLVRQRRLDLGLGQRDGCPRWRTQHLPADGPRRVRLPTVQSRRTLGSSTRGLHTTPGEIRGVPSICRAPL
jgi:hypothetical protein